VEADDQGVLGRVLHTQGLGCQPKVELRGPTLVWPKDSLAPNVKAKTICHDKTFPVLQALVYTPPTKGRWV
jgi:hypothetical protein